MVTEFIKVKNVYGIKELKKANLINGNTLIYAPNGVMKTSFADFVEKVRNCEPIIDAFGEYSSPAEYLIKQNGISYDESTNDGGLQVVVFTSKTAKENVFTDPNIANIAMNAELRRSYGEQVKALEDIKKTIDNIASVTIKDSKKTVFGSWESVARIFGVETDIEAMEQLISYESTNPKLFEDASYSKVCDDKIMKVFEDPDFGEKIKIYREIVNKKMESTIYQNGFDFFQLESISNNISSTNYFEAGHYLTIANKEIKTKEELGIFVQGERNMIFTNPDVEDAFENVKAKLTSNASTRGFSEFLSSNREIIDYSSDYNEARKTFCRTKIIERKQEIEELIKKYKGCLKKIDSLINMAREEESDWKRAKDLFNSRFSLNRVDLEIIKENENGVPVPRIAIIEKKTRQEVNITMRSRLSSGELRALFILNLLFEIESKKKMWPDGFTIILDDVADSFDYKNKYAICRYIEEMFSSNSFETIVMTHNYDFYRCCKYFLSKTSHKELVASKLRRGSIELNNAGHSELQDLSFTSAWKSMLDKDNDTSCNQEATFMAYLTVLRNSIEIERDNDYDVEHESVSRCLHYSDTSYLSDLSYLKPLFKKRSITINDLYYSKTLKEILSSIYSKFERNKKIDQFDIRNKIALAIVLRILYERFLCQKAGKKPIGVNKDINKYYKQLYDNLRDTKCFLQRISKPANLRE